MDTPVIYSCFHCGDQYTNDPIIADNKSFCCNGCQQVYLLLHGAAMDDYYCLNPSPGQNVTPIRKDKYAYLENEEIVRDLLNFKNEKLTTVTFFIPQMHCSSCLWLLENLNRLNAGILNSYVNFASKNVSLTYLHDQISLRAVVELLSSIGYEPLINQEKNDAERIVKTWKQNAIKIGVSGFCFANIMLVSFPEYLGLDQGRDETLISFFRYINIGLAVPALLIGGRDFFVSAWKSIRQHYINIDVPIAIAIAVTFFRSIYEIVSGVGAGYLDSMSGIIFFMLIGRSLQNRTYAHLTFNRDYRSYFPVATTVYRNENEISVKLSEIKKEDILRLHHGEIVPVDSIHSKGKAEIDYSFISGENIPQPVSIGEIIYAGGKIVGSGIEVVAVNEFVQNSFTRLWNNAVFKEETDDNNIFIEKINRYFSLIVLIIASIAFIFWQLNDPSRSWHAFTSVLIIACPCALVLTSSFTYGFLLELFSSKGFFVRSATVLNKLTQINHIVFDKTGTISIPNERTVKYSGEKIADELMPLVKSVLSQSLHPLSRAIVASMSKVKDINIRDFKEVNGQGIMAYHQDILIKAGSASFVGAATQFNTEFSSIFICIDQHIYGYFTVAHSLRTGVREMIAQLRNYHLSLLSGDRDYARQEMSVLLGGSDQVYFNQSPEDKLVFIKSLQDSGDLVMMVGDGLNDAGALKQSHLGVSIVDDKFAFSPACDAVLESSKIQKLGSFIEAAIKARKMIKFIFIYSIIYNMIGLYFAVQGLLQPVIAAIIMPLSSISIIFIAYFGIKIIAARKI